MDAGGLAGRDASTLCASSASVTISIGGNAPRNADGLFQFRLLITDGSRGSLSWPRPIGPAPKWQSVLEAMHTVAGALERRRGVICSFRPASRFALPPHVADDRGDAIRPRIDDDQVVAREVARELRATALRPCGCSSRRVPHLT
jgi:hypothetical protein